MATDRPSTSTQNATARAARAVASEPAGADSQAEIGSSSERAGHSTPSEKPRKKRLWLRVLIIVLVMLVVVVAALAAVFAWDRWYRYDDAADIQGSWYPAGSLAAVQISGDKISFDEQTAYAYTVDPFEKTITYKLGALQGKSHYWFANDRAALVMEDGDAFDARTTAFGDIGHLFAALSASMTGSDLALPEGDGVSVFTRSPDPAAVAAKDEADRQARQAEEAKRKAEEAAARAGEKAEEASGAEGAAEGERSSSESEGTAGSGSSSSADGATKEEPKEFSNESMGIFE